MRRRVAFIDHFPTALSQKALRGAFRRMEVDSYVFAEQREPNWNRRIPLLQEADFRRVELPRSRSAAKRSCPR
jgi:hypothetical protein